MMIKKWGKLPHEMRNDKVRKYYDILKTKNLALFFKQVFDYFASIILIIILFPIMLIISLAITFTSKGPVIFKQTRVTQYCKKFSIYKFRTMKVDEDGPLLTTAGDQRTTKIGVYLRKTKLDELPQLFNILLGHMSFVGPRPEVPKYVASYSQEMMATLLMKAGVTSFASLKFRNESSILYSSGDIDNYYVKDILPIKMKYNLNGIEKYSFFNDIKIMIVTFFSIFQKKR